jgi:hypothetical protein
MDKMYQYSYVAGDLLYKIREKNNHKLQQESCFIQKNDLNYQVKMTVRMFTLLLISSHYKLFYCSYMHMFIYIYQ